MQSVANNFNHLNRHECFIECSGGWVFVVMNGLYQPERLIGLSKAMFYKEKGENYVNILAFCW
ncbi:hypothetical protein VII00023_00190 [Vibrio ichthyoenteri ATCC 700023]|uniref:Uncharacterized protein n=1 Tax=Vibrio ichthyoenteri ATCC 700023 TaxID=870968 RepID=F9S156_9VIBR|nr:hypothetical protein VII00023_00190 [Vibrio ichthyoenteri ATCC 700023]